MFNRVTSEGASSAPPAIDPRIAKRRAGLLSRFADDTAGDVMVIFGLMALVLFSMIGAAIDLGRWLNARSAVIAAADAAVLAGGRELQTNGDLEAAKAVAQLYYNEALKNRITVINDTVSFKEGSQPSSLTADGNAFISTPFMKILGVPMLPLLSANGRDLPEARLAAGGQSDKNVEVAVMLDVSGSMGDRVSGSTKTKISEMKLAAKDLVDIVVWDDQSKYKSRVALVPFSSDVRPPEGWLSSIAPDLYPNGLQVGSGKNKKTYRTTKCVGERAGTEKYTDAAPGAGKYLLRQMLQSNSGNPDCSTPSASTVIPMTSDKSTLTTKINNLALGGGTGGHIGTAWAHYMLSPNWSSVVPGSSAAASYADTKTKKVAILMTDGMYNSVHDWRGITVGDSGSGSSVNGANSPAQAIAICSQMKAKGIEVFTVGFDLGNNGAALNTLSQCATDASHFYNSATGEELKIAFREIALKISSLYLSN